MQVMFPTRLTLVAKVDGFVLVAWTIARSSLLLLFQRVILHGIWLWVQSHFLFSKYFTMHLDTCNKDSPAFSCLLFQRLYGPGVRLCFLSFY